MGKRLPLSPEFVVLRSSTEVLMVCFQVLVFYQDPRSLVTKLLTSKWEALLRSSQALIGAGEKAMKGTFYSGRAIWIAMMLGLFTLIPVITSADEICSPTALTVISTNCPGAPDKGSSPFSMAESPRFPFSIAEGSGTPTGDGGESFLLGHIVIAGDVVIREGGIVTDLLRFVDNGGGKSILAILYSVDDPHSADFTNSSFWKPNHILINETATGPTLYRAIDRVGSSLRENDYTIVSNEELGTVPEPGTLSLIGVGGLALMTRWRKKTKKGSSIADGMPF
jgi:hypothetical protein